VQVNIKPMMKNIGIAAKRAALDLSNVSSEIKK
jgi:hypothetical protein